MQTLKGHKGAVKHLAFVPGANHLLSAAGTGTSFSLRDLGRGKRSYLKGREHKPPRLLSCSRDGTVRTWEVFGGRCLGALDWRHGPLKALAVARDGMRAAVGAHSGEILAWDLG